MTLQEHSQTPEKTVEETKDKDQVPVPLRAEEVSVAKRRAMTGPLKVGTVSREEEFKIVERRLLSLKEEVRLHRTRESNQYQERVVVRQQEAVITRL